MNKKVFCIALVLLTFLAVGSVFADEILQCKDPADGKITVNFLGNKAVATYSGKSAQSFNVWVELEDGSTEMLFISFSKTTAEQTRYAYSNEAKGRIVKVARCNFTAW